MRQRVEIVFKAIERMKKWKSLTISILSQFRIRLTNIYFKWNTMLNIDSIYFFFLHCLQHTHTQHMMHHLDLADESIKILVYILIIIVTFLTITSIGKAFRMLVNCFVEWIFY